MLNARIKGDIKFPKISLLDDLKFVARKIIIPDIIKGINRQMAIMGGKLPKNKPATIARKRKLGQDLRSLIATGKLKKSFFYKARDKFSVLISIKDIRKKIGGYLHDKKYLFFGISKDAEKRAMKYMNKKIKELTRARA